MTLEARRLIDIVSRLFELDAELTIYAAQPWSAESPAVLALEPEDGSLPPEAQRAGMSYFLEVFIAIEFLEGWRAGQRGPFSSRAECERLIQYAINDA